MIALHLSLLLVLALLINSHGGYNIVSHLYGTRFFTFLPFFFKFIHEYIFNEKASRKWMSRSTEMTLWILLLRVALTISPKQKMEYLITIFTLVYKMYVCIF